MAGGPGRRIGELIERRTVTARIHRAAERGFEAAVDRYERGRPSYPRDAVALLVRELGIGAGTHVVELGAGTGKLTALLVPTAARLVAIEPLAAMREALERNVPSARALDGTAEEIPLPGSSTDAVVAAQAFHWFDGPRALAEIHRVLRLGGGLGLIWNVRDETSSWSRRLTEIFDALAGDGPRYGRMRWRAALDRTDLFGPLERVEFPHAHHVGRGAFVDRVLSVSYVASAAEAERRRVVREVERLLDEDPDLAGRDQVHVPYRTDVYWCRRR